MNKAEKNFRAGPGELPSAILVTVGVCLFGGFIHEVSWQRIISFAGLALAAVVISLSVRDARSLLREIGFVPITRKGLTYSMAGITFGMLLGILYNFLKTDALLPATLTGFAFLAPMIGITEELVFRGFVQSKLADSLSVPASVLMATSGHTLYKFIVIKTVPVDLQTHLPSLIVLTFMAGLVFGLMRTKSGSIIPPALAHALFDIVVYGGAAHAPVWVWS